MNNKGVKILLGCVLGTTLLASCGLFRKGKKTNSTKTVVQEHPLDAKAVKVYDTLTVAPPTIVAPKYNEALAAKYAPLWQQVPNYQTFSGKAKCHFEGRGQNQDFTAHIRVKKNEAIWVNVSALGGLVNVARIYATPDSFMLMNYLEKSVTSMRTEEANKVLPFPVDFAMLQNLFIGSALRQDGEIQSIQEETSVTHFNIKKDNFNQILTFNTLNNILSGFKVFLDNDNSVATETLSGYQLLQNINFPKERVIQAINQGYPYLLEMNFTDAGFNTTVDMPFSVPKSYQRK